ncbi:aquaporin AQPAn.G-like isoform X1 [Pomacea canaliculata]|uniref:aquaporin AQPAn.G-like isoform X1 n=2 Tax=Pomacea canaliculata TaxID=400727 RepID=UPI000D728C38|nr:aquaporin AQPAn.G-like isoform X1 [Pomacea canaliculata]XP_025082060.1 aquaporin AQPAn.G-like isoform X1 [Pomacea canaliculata]XP_025082061.1 aquaporin AQPAn.G-like isoform X1 [Pomacea canaliculata]
MSLHSLHSTPRDTAEARPNTVQTACRRLMAQEFEDLRSGNFWRAVVAEFLGCVLLIYFCVGVGLRAPDDSPSNLLEAALAVGFFFAAMLSALMAVSGAHINPAVSIGLLVARHCSFVRFFFYVIAQCAGAITGAALLKAVTPESKIGNLGILLPAKDVSSSQAVMAEFIISFFLLFCVVAMIDKGRTDVQGSIPFIVGIIVSMNVIYAANMSGGTMNPIRNFGPAVITGNMDRHWIFWVGPMLGGAAGGLLYDRVFSTGVTPSSLRKSCLSRNTYASIASEEEGNGDILLQEKPSSLKKDGIESEREV